MKDFIYWIAWSGLAFWAAFLGYSTWRFDRLTKATLKRMLEETVAYQGKLSESLGFFEALKAGRVLIEVEEVRSGGGESGESGESEKSNGKPFVN